MTNVLKLKAKITEKGYTVETLALEIGFNKATLYRKLNRMETFLIKEAYLIAIALDLTERELNEIIWHQSRINATH